RRRPERRPARDGVGRPPAAPRPSRPRAVGRPTAAGVHREGVRLRTPAPRPRRTRRRRRRRVAAAVPGLTHPPRERAPGERVPRLARAGRGRPCHRPRRGAEEPGPVRRDAAGADRTGRVARRAPRRSAAVAGGAGMTHALALTLPYPFDREYMQLALVAGLVVGAWAPLIGGGLVVERRGGLGRG